MHAVHDLGQHDLLSSIWKRQPRDLPSTIMVRFIQGNMHETEIQFMQTQYLPLMGTLGIVSFHSTLEKIPPKGPKVKFIKLIYLLTYSQTAKTFFRLRTVLCYGRCHENMRLVSTGKHETDTSSSPSYVQ